MKKGFRDFPKIKWILASYAVFLALVTFVSSFRETIFFYTLVFLLFFIVLQRFSKKKEDRYDRSLLLGILATFIGAKFLYPNLDQITLTLRTAAILSYVILHGVLLIGPWSRFSRKVQQFYFYRRHLGVTVLLLGAIHAGLVFATYFSFSLNAVFQSIFTFYGFTALFLFFWLGITSWDYLQKTVKPITWKLLHGILMLIWSAVAMYVYSLQKATPNMEMHLGIMGFFLLFWLFVAPYSIIKRIMKTYVFGWKQLHVLIYVIYFSLILHVWLGVVSFETLGLKAVFWLSVAVVLGSHGAGWFIKFWEDRKINKTIAGINKKFEEDGRTFIGVERVDNFEEGKGRKSYIQGKPIAIFKKGNGLKEDRFFTLSNTCRHQKGPIYQGRLLGEVVECPWHYWVYNTKDGNFLGKGKFCLPVYKTFVRDGIVFVSTIQKS